MINRRKTLVLSFVVVVVLTAVVATAMLLLSPNTRRSTTTTTRVLTPTLTIGATPTITGESTNTTGAQQAIISTVTTAPTTSAVPDTSTTSATRPQVEASAAVASTATTVELAESAGDTTTTTAAPATTEAAAVTTQPPVDDPADSGCVGSSYRYQMMVRDACVVEAAELQFTALIAGTWEQRMAAVRDGHLLQPVFERSHQYVVDNFGEETANDLTRHESLWADVDARAHRSVEVYGAQWWTPTSMKFRWRFLLNNGSFTSPWFVTWFTRVDGEWQVAYQSFCRFAYGGCPPDPRPGIAEVTAEGNIPAYDANDDPNRQAVNKGNFPW